MGTTCAGYPLHFHRFIYSKIVKNAQQEVQATKELALSWFPRYKSFEKIVPGKSYANAVTANSQKYNVITDNVKNVGTKDSGKKLLNKSSYRSVSSPRYLQSNRLSSCKTKNPPNKIPNTIYKCYNVLQFILCWQLILFDV